LAGICFGLDAHGRVYCVDGCNWKATATDYADYPQWTSARQSVLDYFEGEAHRELDMIRDEFPGTAAGLAAACEEHLGTALSCYDRLSDATKQSLHDETMVELAEALTSTQDRLKDALDSYKRAKSAWTEQQKNPLKRKAARTRAEELRREMEPLQAELAVEEAALHVDELRRRLVSVKRDLTRERRFAL
jgi:hypothetical protein